MIVIKTPLLEFSDQHIDIVYDLFSNSMTRNELFEQLECLKEWIKKEPHLPQNEDDSVLCKMMILNKCNLEKTKRKIEMFYTGRNFLPELFENREPLHTSMQKIMDNSIILPLPKLNHDNGRVTLVCLKCHNLAYFDINTFCKFMLLTVEIRLHYDVSAIENFIIDMSHASFSFLASINFVTVKKVLTYAVGAYSDIVRGLHFINVPNFTQNFFSMLKLVLKEKMANKIQIHKDLNSLHEYVSKDILPKEYGGTQPSIKILYSNWRKFVESQNTWVIKRKKMRSNEKLRIGEPVRSDMFGMEGSFRKLSID